MSADTIPPPTPDTTRAVANTGSVAAPRTGGRRRLGVTRTLFTATAVFAVAVPALAGPYLVSLAAAALVLAVLAMSTQLLVGVAGLPAFGQPAYFAVGAYTAALLCRGGQTLAPLHLLAAAGTAAVAGAITAPMLLRTRGTAFLMATFAVQSLAATAATQWHSVTGGDEGLHTPAVTLWPGTAPLITPALQYWYVLGATAVIATVIAVLLRSRLALLWRGHAGHEPRMAALGHRVTVHLACGYTIAAAIAGAGGALLVALNQYISPADIGFDTAALTLLAAAIGAGSMRGTVAGAVLIVAARDWAGTGSGGLAPLLLGLLFLTIAYRRPAAAALRRLHTTRVNRARQEPT